MRLDSNDVKNYAELHKTNSTNTFTITKKNENKEETKNVEEIDSVKLAKEMMKKSNSRVKINLSKDDGDTKNALENEVTPKKLKVTKKVVKEEKAVKEKKSTKER